MSSLSDRKAGNEVVDISPRYMSISNDSPSGMFQIKNISKDNRIILFKIKRPADVNMDFSPRSGVVEALSSVSARVTVQTPLASKARFFVKIVALPKEKAHNNFKLDWELGKEDGEIKKLIEIRNKSTMSSIEEHLNDASPISSKNTDAFDDSCSTMSESFADSCLSEYSDRKTIDFPISTNKSLKSTPISHFPLSREKNNQFDSINSVIGTNIEGNPMLLKTISDLLSQVSDDNSKTTLLMGLGLGLGMSVAPSSTTLSSNLLKRFDAGSKENNIRSSERDSKALLSSELCSISSQLILFSNSRMNNSVDNIPGRLMLQIQGSNVSNATLSTIITQRIAEAHANESIISAIEISNSPIDSMELSFKNCIHPKPEESNGQLCSRLLQEDVRYLIINFTSISKIDLSINHFHALSNLDLSSNQISSIVGLLELRNLVSLNISGNKLKSLDFLQELHSLKSLYAAHNQLNSLRTSIHMLLPLQESLSVLDLSSNPICKQQRYVDEVMELFPYLRYFDMKDLVVLRKSMQSSYSPGESKSDSSPESLSGEISGMSPSEKKFESRIKRALKRQEYNEKKKLAQKNPNLVPQHPSNVNQYSTPKKQLEHDKTIGTVALPMTTNYVVSSSSSSSSSVSDAAINSVVHLMSNNNNNNNSNTTNKIPFQSEQLQPSSTNSKSSTMMNHSQTSQGTTVGSIQGELKQGARKFMLQTSASKSRRKSQNTCLVDHWSAHRGKDDSLADSKFLSNSFVPMNSSSSMSSQSKVSTLLMSTGSTKSRRKSFGIGPSDLSQVVASFGDTSMSRGYHSDSEYGMKKSFRDGLTFTSQQIKEMQEDPRYSIWHPRYRIPVPVFGYSKPFIHRANPDSKNKVPLFDKFVDRLRDGFQKLPTRGTFTRASKGLTAEFYPMDYTDLEAIRRQGYFHETIGDTQKYSYRDLRSKPQQDFSVSLNGSICISPQKSGRRGSIGQHMSRQYKAVESQLDDSRFARPDDDYSDYQKWYNAEQHAPLRRASLTRSNSDQVLNVLKDPTSLAIMPNTPGLSVIHATEPSHSISKIFGNTDGYEKSQAFSEEDSQRSSTSRSVHSNQEDQFQRYFPKDSSSNSHPMEEMEYGGSSHRSASSFHHYDTEFEDEDRSRREDVAQNGVSSTTSSLSEKKSVNDRIANEKVSNEKASEEKRLADYLHWLEIQQAAQRHDDIHYTDSNFDNNIVEEELSDIHSQNLPPQQESQDDNDYRNQIGRADEGDITLEELAYYSNFHHPREMANRPAQNSPQKSSMKDFLASAESNLRRSW